MKGLALLLLLASVSAARAQTAEDIHACYLDAVRLCGVSKDGKPPATMADIAETARVAAVLTVGTCLVSHREQLSPRCRAAFADHGL